MPKRLRNNPLPPAQDLSPSLAQNVLQDINRHVLGGARVDPTKSTQGHWQPLSFVTRQQKRATLDPNNSQVLSQDAAIFTAGSSSVTVNGHAGAPVRPIERALLNQDQFYFNLTEDLNVPYWVAAQKQFSLPYPPAPEYFVPAGATGSYNFIHLPPAILREASTPTPPRVTLCNLVRNKDDSGPSSGGNTQLVPVDDSKTWSPAILLRCPLTRLSQAAPVAAGARLRRPRNAGVIVFELKGIPQGERWYLDKLDLLPPVSSSGKRPKPRKLPKNATLSLYLEYTDAQNNRKQVSVPSWCLARKNLTGLARPGSANLAKAKDASNLPYVGTNDSDDEQADTLRLIQMASITNSGGYYLRPDQGAAAKATGTNVSLLICLRYEPDADPGDKSHALPQAANAYCCTDTDPVKPAAGQVIRFQDPTHLNIQPIAPQGTITFGLMRQLNWKADSTTEMGSSSGFAESIHLVDYEVSDAAAPSNPPLISGDQVPPISPTLEVSTPPGQIPAGMMDGLGVRRSLAILTSDKPSPPASSADGTTRYHHYRKTVPFATNPSNAFAFLAGTPALKFSTGFRDLYGNRLLSNNWSFSRRLFYTDALISPSEWPGYHFSVFPQGGKLTFVVRYFDTDPITVHMGNIPDAKAFLVALTALTPFPQFVLGRLGTPPTLNSDQDKPLFLRWVAKGLNTLIDGPSFYTPALFQGIRLSTATQDLLASNQTGRNLRLLNRRLLQDAFPTVLSSPANYNLPTSFSETLRKLQLIVSQLRGVNQDDVAVTLVDAGRDPLGDPDKIGRGNFSYSPLIDNVKALLIANLDSRIAYLHDILTPKTSPNPPPPVPRPVNILSWTYDVTSTNGKSTAPAQMYPLLQISRAKSQWLPTTEYPHDTILQKQVKNQVTYAESAVSMGLSSSVDDTAADAEYRLVAQAFDSNLSGSLSGRFAFARNRFNEHELWVVPLVSLPNACVDSLPLFSTARPLNTQLGNESFQLPDYKKWDTSQPPSFPLTPQTQNFARVDYDALGRKVLALTEDLLTPENTTDQLTKKSSTDRLWEKVLQGKDIVARAFADFEPNANANLLLVPLFSSYGADQTKNQNGVRRMGLDAFQNKLSSFYNIDTFVGLPLAFPPLTTHSVTAADDSTITNFYGVTQPPDFKRPKVSTRTAVPTPVTKPSFSDFVLSATQDFDQNNPRQGYLTLAYDLPPGEEMNWSAWHFSQLGANLTHVQVSVPWEPARHSFDEGQWLQLANAWDFSGSWNFNDSPIPAIERTFPDEPVLQHAVATRYTPTNLDPAENPANLHIADASSIDICTRFGWEVDFAGLYNANDKAYLQMTYGVADSVVKPNTLLIRNRVDWTPANLFEALVALNSLLTGYSWTGAVKNDAPLWSAVEALGNLLVALGKQLNNRSVTMQATGGTTIDTYELPLSASSTNGWKPIPSTVNNQAQKVQGILYCATANAAPDKPTVYQIKVDATPDPTNILNNPLRLFGGKLTSINYTPSLKVTRNEDLGSQIPSNASVPYANQPTNSPLIYTCGPVVWPSEVRVTNKWATVKVTTSGTPDLEQLLYSILNTLFGGAAPDAKLQIRIDLRHAFDVFNVRNYGFDPVTPIAIFPVDYDYDDLQALAKKMTEAYLCWLTRLDDAEYSPPPTSPIYGTPAAILKSVINPRLQLGIQIACSRASTSISHNHRIATASIIPGRVVLEIETIEISLANVTFPTN